MGLVGQGPQVHGDAVFQTRPVSGHGRGQRQGPTVGSLVRPRLAQLIQHAGTAGLHLHPAVVRS